MRPAFSKLPADEPPSGLEPVLAPLEPSVFNEARQSSATIMRTTKSNRPQRAPFWHNQKWDFDKCPVLTRFKLSLGQELRIL